MVTVVTGGPGWVLADDLRPVITDLDAFREGLAGDPLALPVELLFSGQPAEALAHLTTADPTPRVRALRADCLRDLGQFAHALREYDALVAESVGTAHEAVMRQHRGKSRLAAGQTRLAIEDFTIAVRLREHGTPDLLASSRQALDLAERLLAIDHDAPVSPLG